MLKLPKFAWPRFFPVEIRIHTWGGLGSQLHALALQIYLSQKYSNRNFVLVFHSNGSTRRCPDPNIVALSPNSQFIDDYCVDSKKRTKPVILSLVSNLKNALIYLLSSLQFSIRPNRLSDVTIKPWTREFRSHYSRIQFPLSTYQTICKLMNFHSRFDIERDLCIHVRAGDLLTLKDKTIVPVSKILEISRGIQLRNPVTNFYCESPSWLKNELKKHNYKADYLIRGPEVEPILLLRECISSRIFIGTESKLSIWIALFRLICEERETIIPDSLQENFRDFAPKELLLKPNYY